MFGEEFDPSIGNNLWISILFQSMRSGYVSVNRL